MQKSNDPLPSSEPAVAPAKPPEHNAGMIRAAGLVGFLTILSRVLGLWRFRVMASIFGASGVADAFNFAFVFPNLTRRLFGEGALTSAFVPVFSGRLAKGDKDAASRTASVLLCRLGMWLSLWCLAGMVAVHVARLIRPDLVLELSLLEWMLPYLVFINLAAILMGILNSMGHFGMPAFAPVILNVLMIAACSDTVRKLFGSTESEWIWGVAYAVLAGGILQLFVQVPAAIAKGFKFTPSLQSTDPGYAEVMTNFKPVVLLVAVFQINVLVDNIIAKHLIPGDGPVTYLNMGTSVYQLPWSIFALALGSAALPALSRFWAEEKKEQFSKTLLSALRLTIYWAVPCTVGIVLLSDDIVRFLYGTGRFLDHNAEPVARTAGVVVYSSLGLVFFSVNAILARALYAMKDMKTPTTTSAQSVAINLALNLLLVLGTRFKGVTVGMDKTLVYSADAGMKEAGIALASTLSNAWQTWMLMRALKRHLGETQKGSSGLKFGFFMTSTAVVSGVIAYLVYRYFQSQPDTEGFYGFFAAIGLTLVPFWFVGRTYFNSELHSRLKLTPEQMQDPEVARYGVPEELWPEDLKLQHSIYTTILCSAIMGYLVWAVRDSLPPEGQISLLVAQRAIIPVVAGIFVYATSSSGFLAREYEELWSAVWRRKQIAK